MNRDDIANYTVTETLRDQQPVTIRAIRPGDKELFREAFEGLEAGSIYMRFFGPRKELTDRELIQATEVDFIQTVALVACVQEGTRERIIGGRALHRSGRTGRAGGCGRLPFWSRRIITARASRRSCSSTFC